MEVYDELEEALKEIERLNLIIEIKNNRIQQLMKRTRSARIDKAIEYIEEQSKFIKGCDIYRICNKDVLLNILKGSDKE